MQNFAIILLNLHGQIIYLCLLRQGVACKKVFLINIRYIIWKRRVG